MRRFVTVPTIVMAMLCLALSPGIITGDGPSIPTSGLKVEERLVYIYQNDDRTTVRVDELIFFNNSGTSDFNGTVYNWIPEGSLVIADYYGNATDTGCRILDLIDLHCFSLDYQDGNIAFGNPFAESKLSYFGEKGTVIVNAQSQNFSDSDSITLNVTVGGVTEPPSSSVPSGSGIHIFSDSLQLGVRGKAMPGLSSHLVLTQTIKVFNNGTQNDTVDLGMQNAPSDWNASLLQNNREVASIVLNASETKNVTLNLSIPSYLAEVIISYSTSMPRSTQDYYHLLFDKTFLYDNDRVVMYVYTVEGDNITVSDGLTLVHSQWNEDSLRTMHVIFGSDIRSGTEVLLTFVLEPDQNLSWLLLLAAVVVFLAIIALSIMRKRRRSPDEAPGKTEEDTAEGVAGDGSAKGATPGAKNGAEGMVAASAKGKKVKTRSEKTRQEGKKSPDKRMGPNGSSSDGGAMSADEPGDIAKKKKSIADAINRLENDHEEGLISDEVYLEMKESLKKRDSMLDDRLQESRGGGIAALAREKDMILKAARHLDRDLESGRISKEAYAELRGGYKKRTIEIMKKIDRMRKG